jgi:hypothetical protein
MWLGMNVRGKHSRSQVLQEGGGGETIIYNTETPNAQHIINGS